MASRISKAVFDTGPLIHLNEIESLNILVLFKSILLAEEVFIELRKNTNLLSKVGKIKNIKLTQLNSRHKDMSKLLVEKYNIGLAESCSISLSMQEKAIFITDDLDARTVAKNLELEVHGTVGVIVRAYKEKIISKETAIGKILELYKNSSLFVTKDIVDWVIREIREHK